MGSKLPRFMDADITVSNGIPENVLVAVSPETIAEADRIESHPHLRDVSGGRVTIGLEGPMFACQAVNDKLILVELTVADLLWLRERVRLSLEGKL